LIKLFARKRTYLGFGVFLGVEMLILVLWQLPRGQRWMKMMIEQSGGAFDLYFSGLTVAMIMVTTTIFLLGGLYLGLVSGDLIAKEVEDGTMRMTLCRPVSRVRVLLVKYVTSVLYTFALVFFIGLSALAAATLVRGGGGLFLMIPEEKLVSFFEFGDGLRRYFAALPCLALSLLSISTFSFQLSCWNVKPAAATIGAITVFFVDWILHLVPYFETYRPWMMTTHMHTWLNVFRDPVPWAQMVEDYAYLGGLNATFLLVGLAVFSARDFKS
jgi:ABC-2 type transport system permease protein